MATKIPPHNLTEILDAHDRAYQESRDHDRRTDQDRSRTGFSDRRIYLRPRGDPSARIATGRGIIQMRARAVVDEIGRGDRVRDAVVITEIPYQVNKARLIEKIAELVHEKRLDGISEIRDESNREGMRIVIELKRDAVPQVVLNKLYKLTPMQSSFGIINIAIVDGQPKLLNLKQMLEAFVEFRREVVRRRTEFDLRKGAGPCPHLGGPQQGDRRARLHHSADPQFAFGR